MEPRVLTWCLEAWWGLSGGVKLRFGPGFGGVAHGHPLGLLIRSWMQDL